MTELPGRLFILSGPSGSGKDTILQIFLEKHPEVCFSISCVTRAMRPGEREGEKYHFISKAAFEDMIRKGEMLEYAEYCGNFYGTPKGPIIDWLKAGKNVIVEVDVQGAKKIYDAMPQAVKIFVMPPSMEVLKQRLLGRKTESEEVARKRLGAAVKEISQAREYHYILTNDKLGYAVLLLESVLTAEAIKTNQMQNFIDEVLQDAESIHW